MISSNVERVDQHESTISSQLEIEKPIGNLVSDQFIDRLQEREEKKQRLTIAQQQAEKEVHM